jgi:dTDP-4-amino-4,6-dideoxygalactose transaminase
MTKRPPGIPSLAIFGGRPAFAEKLHVGRPNLGNAERFLERTRDILQRRWFTNYGHCVQEFEKELSRLLGVKHCIVMCNATVALEITVRALEMKGEVIVPSFTFIATAHALQWQKITPVFCDLDPATHNLDPARVEKLITPRTTGIVGVHVWGRPCAVEALGKIAARHRLKLVFDAAHAFACSHQGRMIGGFGHAEVFSFHATKFFNTFEGGAVATNDDALAAKIRLMKNFGFQGMDNVVYIGTNGKMTEISAAMGLTGLESLDEFVKTNRRNYHLYLKLLAEQPGLKPVRYDEAERCNYQYIIFEVDEARARISRDQLLAVLHAENVLARRYFYPGCHRMEPYRTRFPDAGRSLPQTERLAQRVLSLPNGTSVGPREIRKICQVIRLAIKHGGQIRRELLKREGVER